MADAGRYGPVTVPGIPEDEPVFILRARDETAPEILRLAAAELDARAGTWDSLPLRAAVLHVRRQFLRFQAKNPELTHLPGIPLTDPYLATVPGIPAGYPDRDAADPLGLTPLSPPPYAFISRGPDGTQARAVSAGELEAALEHARTCHAAGAEAAP